MGKYVYTDLYFRINDNLYITRYTEDIFFILRSQNILAECNEVVIFITDTGFENCKNIIWIALYCFNVLGKKVNIICPDLEITAKFDQMKIDRRCYEIYPNIPEHLRGDATCVAFQTHADDEKHCFGYMVNTAYKSFYFGESYNDIPEEIFSFYGKGIIDSINVSQPIPPDSGVAFYNNRQ